MARPVLCAVDFSPTADRVLQYGLLLAQAEYADIQLFHVCDIPHYVRPDLIVSLEGGGARPMSEIAEADARLSWSHL